MRLAWFPDHSEGLDLVALRLVDSEEAEGEEEVDMLLG